MMLLQKNIKYMKCLTLFKMRNSIQCIKEVSVHTSADKVENLFTRILFTKGKLTK